MRKYLQGKLHRVRVTEADVDYEGSITIDHRLMDMAGLEEHEVVSVWGVNTDERIETYALRGAEGVICLNGGAAHRFSPGDIVIIAWYQYGEMKMQEPTVILCDPETNLPKPGPNVRDAIVKFVCSQSKPVTLEQIETELSEFWMNSPSRYENCRPHVNQLIGLGQLRLTEDFRIAKPGPDEDWFRKRLADRDRERDYSDFKERSKETDMGKSLLKEEIK